MYLHDLGIVCALGADKESVLAAWLAGVCPQPAPAPWLDSTVPALAVRDEWLSILPATLRHYDCRNNRILLAASRQIQAGVDKMIRRYGSGRVGLVLGTSTSGIAEGEQALKALSIPGQLPGHYHYKQQELGGAAEFLSLYLGIQGPAYTVSTTCSSSANALASARRMLRLGICDAVVVGGGDALCRTTLEGFAALGVLSQTRCNPFSRHRDGTLIGEGAALFLMTEEPAPTALLGVGTSSDAYHLSAPHPDGIGAYAAMQTALQDAQLTAAQVGYINLHGTATVQNDAMESKAVNKLFGSEETACGSSKPATGHCLGAAGAIEAGLCWLLLSDWNHAKRLPPHLWDGLADDKLETLHFVSSAQAPMPLQYCLSNSFAFGGNNVSLLTGKL